LPAATELFALDTKGEDNVSYTHMNIKKTHEHRRKKKKQTQNNKFSGEQPIIRKIVIEQNSKQRLLLLS
jgi:hypothetical protein